MSSYFFSQNPISKRAAVMDETVKALEKEVGMSSTQKQNTKAILGGLAAGRSAEEVSKVSIKGGNQHFKVEGVSHNGDNREVHAYRKNESGMFEKMVAVEEKISDDCYVVSEVRYG